MIARKKQRVVIKGMHILEPLPPPSGVFCMLGLQPRDWEVDCLPLRDSVQPVEPPSDMYR